MTPRQRTSAVFEYATLRQRASRTSCDRPALEAALIPCSCARVSFLATTALFQPVSFTSELGTMRPSFTAGANDRPLLPARLSDPTGNAGTDFAGAGRRYAARDRHGLASSAVRKRFVEADIYQ